MDHCTPYDIHREQFLTYFSEKCTNEVCVALSLANESIP